MKWKESIIQFGKKYESEDYQRFGIQVKDGGLLELEEGSVFFNICSSKGDGEYDSLVNLLNGGKAIFNHPYIEEFRSMTNHGHIVKISPGSEIKIYGGTYKSSLTSNYGSIFNYGTLYVYGGDFIGNEGKCYGGAIGTLSETYILGGNFRGNIVKNGDFNHMNKGGGMHVGSEAKEITLSGNAKFYGDESSSYPYIDTIYLELKRTGSGTPGADEYAKIRLVDTLEYPVKICLSPFEGRIVAKGTEDYILQSKRDGSKLEIIDIDNTGKTWYKILDRERNLIYLSETEPVYQFLNADFYSGEKCEKETKTLEISKDDTGTITTPKLKEMPGWNILGWNRDISKYECDTEEEKDVVLTEDTSFYGIYQKDVSLSYDLNTGDQINSETSLPKAEKKSCFANVHEKITYQIPEFQIASAPVREGYLFQGWNTKADGRGTSYPADSIREFDQDTVLYAKWERDPNAVSYKIEHYQQNLEGEGYTKIDADTEILFGTKGSTVAAKAKEYEGFTENTLHPSRNAVGTLTENEDLVLKLYYDRNIYEISFDLNGGTGTVPETQKIRYGGLLQRPKDPIRRGYNFKNWYLNEKNERLWDFSQPVEKNTSVLQTVLLANWKDELAPMMEKASFHSGYKDLLNWIIRKPGITVTIPVIEEGSGLKNAEYTLIWEDGREEKGTTQRAGAKDRGLYAYKNICNLFHDCRIWISLVIFCRRTRNYRTGKRGYSSKVGELGKTGRKIPEDFCIGDCFPVFGILP